MSGCLGHVLDMQKRDAHNRAMKTSNKRSPKQVNSYSGNTELTFKEVSKDELEAIKTAIRNKSQKRSKIGFIAFSAAFLAICVIGSVMFVYL